jgi:hypothetical protein
MTTLYLAARASACREEESDGVVLAIRCVGEEAMAQVVRVISTPLLLDGVPYRAQVCAQRNRHMWEGWIEFASEDGSDVRRTGRETTQPDLDAVVYWADGLSGTYLEGALARTLTRSVIQVEELPEPFFDGPAADLTVVGPPTEVDRAVLDPFSVGAKGEDLLRSELGALRAWHLRNIVRAYDLAKPSVKVEAMGEAELIDLIVAAVQPV